ncbi:hypothetical protein CHS0354_028923, partial [Potamilus streckersoni]
GTLPTRVHCPSGYSGYSALVGTVGTVGTLPILYLNRFAIGHSGSSSTMKLYTLRHSTHFGSVPSRALYPSDYMMVEQFQ